MLSPEVSTIVDAQEKSFMDDPRNAKRIYRRVIAQCRFVCVFIFDLAIAHVLGLGPIWAGLAARNLQLHARQCHEKEHWAMTSQSAPPVTAALFALLPSTVSEYQDSRFLHWQTDEPRLAHFPSPLLPSPPSTFLGFPTSIRRPALLENLFFTQALSQTLQVLS